VLTYFTDALHGTITGSDGGTSYAHRITLETSGGGKTWSVATKK